jgi:hypothetical protein
MDDRTQHMFFHRADGNAVQPGDIAVMDTFHTRQKENLPGSLAEFRQGLLDILKRFLPHQNAFRRPILNQNGG